MSAAMLNYQRVGWFLEYRKWFHKTLLKLAGTIAVICQNKPSNCSCDLPEATDCGQSGKTLSWRAQHVEIIDTGHQQQLQEVETDREKHPTSKISHCVSDLFVETTVCLIPLQKCRSQSMIPIGPRNDQVFEHHQHQPEKHFLVFNQLELQT
jgi:hypothetical protein